MIRDVKLLGHLPPFIQEYLEIREIMKTENPEFQLVEDESEIIKNNQFIQSCNLTGISKFEKLIGIVPSADDTLESRINRVLVRWNDTVPYTWKTLLNKLDTLCGGSDNYEIIRKLDEHKLEITTHLDLYGQVEELDYFLSYMLPASMVLDAKNKLFIDLNATARVAAGIVNCETFELSDSFKKNLDIQGTSIFGGGIVEGYMTTLSDAFKKGMSIDSGAWNDKKEIFMMMNFKKNQNNAVCSMDCKNCPHGASQPNPMDDPMFEKSIVMLHNWLMLEAIREDHPKERIVMVILPGAGGELLTEDGSRDIFEDVYDEMEADLVADGELLLHYDKSDVIETDRTRYLLGAAEVSEIDQNGNECSINLFTLERTIDYVNENLTVVSIGGELVPALRLI